jgi:hypothetical protein
MANINFDDEMKRAINECKIINNVKLEWMNNLRKSKSIYDGIECKERVNIQKCIDFYYNEMGICKRDMPKLGKYNVKYESDHKMMYNYLMLMTDGIIYTQHKLPKHKWGRVEPVNHLSQSVFMRGIRHSACEGKYIDIDMKNCQITIVLAFARYNGLPCDMLEIYCSDVSTFRQKIVTEHFGDDVTEVDGVKVLDLAKQLVLRICFGGKYTTWKRENKIKKSVNSSNIVKLESELSRVRELVYFMNPCIERDVIRAGKHNFDDGEKDIKRTVLGLWCQTIERIVIEYAIGYFDDCSNIIPCQDGMLIDINLGRDGLIDDIESYVEHKFGLGMKFAVKEFNECLTIPETGKSFVRGIESRGNTDEIGYFDCGIKGHEVTQALLDLDYNEFANNKTYVVKSGTGTGKSRQIARFCAKYCEGTDYTVLCLSNLISILDQLKGTFDAVGIDLQGYSDVHGAEIIGTHSYICINSILKFMKCESYFSNVILYIDEPTNLLFSLTGDGNIDNIVGVFSMFMKLVKRCHKLIMTDAHIGKDCKELIEKRNQYQCVDTVSYHINDHKKYAGVDAIHVNDRKLFVSKMVEQVKNNDNFVFVSDSKKTTIWIYKTCLEHAKDKSLFKLITSDTKDTIIADIDFNKSFTFFSPRVTCGLNIHNERKTNTYVYNTCQSINPITMHQQSMRNRQVDKMYFFIKDKQRKRNQFHDYASCKRYHREEIMRNSNILNMCSYIDDNEEIVTHENFYFNLYCRKAYIESIMFSDVRYYFEKELRSAGFTVSECGCSIQYDDKEQDEVGRLDLAERIDDAKIKLDSGISVGDMTKLNCSIINECIYFGISSGDELETYRSIIGRKKKTLCFTNFEKMLRTKEYIIWKIKEKKAKTFGINRTRCKYTCALLARQWEEACGIKQMDIEGDIDVFNENGKCDGDVLRTLTTLRDGIANIFDVKRVDITCNEDLRTIYLQMVTHMCKFGVVESGRKRNRGPRVKYKAFNVDNLKWLMGLLALKYKGRYKGFSETAFDIIGEYIGVIDKCVDFKSMADSTLIKLFDDD